MKVSRRDFLKYCVGSATTLGLSATTLGSLEKALYAATKPTVIWINASNCTGCTVSLANRVATSAPVDVADLLINHINLAFHPNLMGAAGDLAVSQLVKAEAGPFVLAVEGGIPTAFGGRTCYVYSEKYSDPTAPGGVSWRDVTALEAVQRLAPKAMAILSIGTCASFGGVCGAAPNPTASRSVKTVTNKTTINISGCPTHPDWIVGVIANLIAGVSVPLDSVGRPTAFFSSRVHERCPRRELDWATTFGRDGLCLRGLGCKGPVTRADCPTRKWNKGTNWCVGANAICLGCTESGFPDKFSPLYSGAGALPSDHPSVTNGRSCFTCHDSSGEADD